jgi:hypothetical protein
MKIKNTKKSKIFGASKTKGFQCFQAFKFPNSGEEI